jgi:hypothetical protein
MLMNMFDESKASGLDMSSGCADCIKAADSFAVQSGPLCVVLCCVVLCCVVLCCVVLCEKVTVIP